MKPKYHNKIKRFGEKQKTYGLNKTSFYNAWRNMFPRCLDKNHPGYKYYGDRGITICDEWFDFRNFIKDMYELWEYHVENFGDGRKNCQLDRIDNNKGYYKDNCRWATAKLNNNNRRDYKRMGNARYIEYRGKKLCIKDWAKELDMKYTTLIYRLNRAGWSVEKAFYEPVDKYTCQNL